MSKLAGERGAVMQMKWASVFVISLSLAFATGCSEESPAGAPTTADFMQERAALATAGPTTPKRSPTPAAGEAASEEDAGYATAERDYFYDPRDKRDPFRSFRFLTSTGDQDKTEYGPLADFELAQLELQAVIWDANNPRALILDPGGRAYIVREGSQIGKNSGQVIHIGDNLVLVKETYENLAGEETTKDVELRIRLSQGG
jgi:type IV pilus assembly protein PilP